MNSTLKSFKRHVKNNNNNNNNNVKKMQTSKNLCDNKSKNQPRIS